jgi:hypothetical protein
MFGGEALTLWRLRRPAGNLRCFVVEWPGTYWLGVECAGGELLVSETLTGLTTVMARADQIKRPLLEEGWVEE